MFRNIVVGTDGSPSATEAVRKAAELARLCGAWLHLVTAYHPARVAAAVAVGPEAAAAVSVAAVAEAEESLRADAEAVLERAKRSVGGNGPNGPNFACQARAGGAGEVLVAVAEEVGADLIVLGNRGMSGPRRFLLGSVPSRVAHHAPCAVMIVQTI